MRKLKSLIKKLRLQKGDVIIAHPSLQDQLINLRIPNAPNCNFPIILTDNVRNIRRIPKKELKQALEILEKQ